MHHTLVDFDPQIQAVQCTQGWDVAARFVPSWSWESVGEVGSICGVEQRERNTARISLSAKTRIVRTARYPLQASAAG